MQACTASGQYLRVASCTMGRSIASRDISQWSAPNRREGGGSFEDAYLLSRQPRSGIGDKPSRNFRAESVDARSLVPGAEIVVFESAILAPDLTAETHDVAAGMPRR